MNDHPPPSVFQNRPERAADDPPNPVPEAVPCTTTHACDPPTRSDPVHDLVAAGVTAGHPKVGPRRPHLRDVEAWAAHQRERKAANQLAVRKRGARRVIVRIGKTAETFEWVALMEALGVPRDDKFRLKREIEAAFMRLIKKIVTGDAEVKKRG